MSSISPLPSFREMSSLRIARISTFLKTLKSSSKSRSKRADILTLPTADKSYLSLSKNKPLKSASAVSGAGGSPGRITRYISTKASSLEAFLSKANVFLIQGPTDLSMDKIEIDCKSCNLTNWIKSSVISSPASA